jgi:hypothetical protein
MQYLNQLPDSKQKTVLKKVVSIAKQKMEVKKKNIRLIRDEIIVRVKQRSQMLDDRQRSTMGKRLKKDGVAVVVAEQKVEPADAATLHELMEDDLIDRQFYHYFSEDSRRKLFTGTVVGELAGGKLKIRYVRDEDGAVTIEIYTRVVLCVDLICGDLIVIA